MNTFFIEFRDPLFGIIVFFILLFILSFFSYWWGRYKTAKEHRDLESFLGKFESLEKEERMSEQVHTNSLSSESWLMLAHSFEVQGNYEKSVEIYHSLLAKNRDTIFQKEVLLLLGRSYFKAGFLERSRQTFLQLLQNHPRTPQALLNGLILLQKKIAYLRAVAVGNDNAIVLRKRGDLPDGNAQVVELLLDGSLLPLADQGIAAQRHQ